MLCSTCQTESRKFGKDRKGNQRYQCQTCKATFADMPNRPLGDMRISLDKALIVLHHLVEGVSVRATMRLTGTNRNTILDLLYLIGTRCEELLAGRISSTARMTTPLKRSTRWPQVPLRGWKIPLR